MPESFLRPPGLAATAATAAAPRLARAGTPTTQARAAKEFEAQVLGVMLQTMFHGLGQGGAFGGGAAEAQWRPMLVEEYARSLARAGGIGLADAVLREMQRLQEG
jgi:peptidoglycan hydrolase FlgJ